MCWFLERFFIFSWLILCRFGTFLCLNAWIVDNNNIWPQINLTRLSRNFQPFVICTKQFTFKLRSEKLDNFNSIGNIFLVPKTDFPINIQNVLTNSINKVIITFKFEKFSKVFSKQQVSRALEDAKHKFNKFLPGTIFFSQLFFLLNRLEYLILKCFDVELFARGAVFPPIKVIYL